MTEKKKRGRDMTEEEAKGMMGGEVAQLLIKDLKHDAVRLCFEKHIFEIVLQGLHAVGAL